MANHQLTLDLDVSGGLLSIEKVTGALGGLENVLAALGQKLARLLAGTSLIRYLYDAAVSSDRLDKSLLALRVSLSRLRSAIGEAFVPILQTVLPAVQSAVYAAVRFVNYIAKLISTLFGVRTASVEAAEGQKAFAAASRSSAKAAKRSLAGFDQITRLNAPTGGSSGGGGGISLGEDAAELPPVLEKLSLAQTLILGVLRETADYIRGLDYEPLKKGLERIRAALKPLGMQLFKGLCWALENVLLPLSKWTVETALPLFLETVGAGLEALSAALESSKPMLNYFWNEFLKPLGQWAAAKLVEGLTWLKEKLEWLTWWMEHNMVSVEDVVVVVGLITAAVLLLTATMKSFNAEGTVSTEVTRLLHTVVASLEMPLVLIIGLVAALAAGFVALVLNVDQVTAAFRQGASAIKTAWQSVVSWFKTNVLSPLQSGFRTTFNGIIGFINAMLKGAVSGINTLVRAVNKLNFTVPSWVPGIGGKSYGFNLKTVSCPTVPYLAQGAVLPPNKPFLAMVGDQRHGTNVEAPLATIQEAVALVMQDQTAAIMAGFNASVGVQREILEAVLGISIGDTQIAQAVDRYRSKMAVVKGGVL